MADYHILYTGHISWEGRSNGLPEKIFCLQMIESEGKGGILKAIQDQANHFFITGGMSVSEDPARLIDPNKLNLGKMYVPMRWIVRITVKVTPVINVPMKEDADGELKEQEQ